MSESAPESSGGGGNVFTRKVGPLPMWAWMAIALVLALAYYLIKSKSSSSSSAAQSANSSTDSEAAGGVDSSLVPQFVNQTYVNGTPPAAPAVPTTTAAPTTTTSQTINAYSWTDTGQKWSPQELASHLGISIGALQATNAAGKKALSQPTKPIPKGAKFDYTKEPKGITTSTTVTGTPKAT